MRKIKMWMLGMEIERKWKKIAQNRRRMAALIEKKVPYSSPQLVELDRATARLGFEAQNLEARYRKLAGKIST